MTSNRDHGDGRNDKSSSIPSEGKVAANRATEQKPQRRRRSKKAASPPPQSTVTPYDAAEERVHEIGRTRDPVGRNASTGVRATLIEWASLFASVAAAIAAAAGVWVSQGQLREMKAQRIQDDADNKASDRRQDKLISAAATQAENMGNLAKSSAGQLVSIKRSADAAIAQAEAALAAGGATDRLAKSSGEQVKVLLDADRAWISAATVPESKEFVVGEDFIAFTEITNIGKSPAIKVRSFTSWDVAVRTSPYVTPEECKTCAIEAIFPSGFRNMKPNIPGKVLTEDLVSSLKSGDKIFIVRVRVDYYDVNGRRHLTNLCSYYNVPTKGFTACNVGNEAT